MRNSGSVNVCFSVAGTTLRLLKNDFKRKSKPLCRDDTSPYINTKIGQHMVANMGTTGRWESANQSDPVEGSACRGWHAYTVISIGSRRSRLVLCLAMISCHCLTSQCCSHRRQGQDSLRGAKCVRVKKEV